MKILVVDDDPIHIRLLKTLLQHQGHDITTTGDGAVAWEMLQLNAYNVLVTDWEMPGLDGIELVRRVRSQARPSYLYIILLTVRNRREDMLEGMEAGVDDFLSRPILDEDLIARLRVAQRIIGLQAELLEKNRALEGFSQRLHHDLQAAVRVQRSLLPTKLPILPDLSIAWRSVPCDELGGDTLNVFQLDENHIGFYILDASGHGVSSALLAVQVSRLLTPLMSAGSLLKEPIPDPPGYRLVRPGEVMTRLNALFPFQYDAPQFFTIFYGVLDIRDFSLDMALAGHPGPILVHEGQSSDSLDLASNPVGLFDADEAEFAEVSTRLKPGDRLCVYSDGVTEAWDPAGNPFPRSDFHKLLEDRGAASLDGVLGNVVDALTRWRSGRSPSDDVSLLAVERAAETHQP